jgi:ABC-type sugar transport system permease subunit
VFRRAIEGLNIGFGAAIGVVVVILSIIVITLVLRALDRLLREV